VRGEVGPRRFQRDGVAIEPDELRVRSGVEDATGVSGTTESGVDDDSPMLQCREEERGDLICEYRLVVHGAALALSI
jgi:hypothetical protein